jgi:hypothetical protein
MADSRLLNTDLAELQSYAQQKYHGNDRVRRAERR